MSVLRKVWKGVAGGLAAAASAAGIVVADLEWQGIVAAFVVGLLGVYFAPANQTGTTTARRTEGR